MTGVAKNTVVKLVVDLGRACSEFQDEALSSLRCKQLQLDEIWSFVYAKTKNVPAEKAGEFGVGDVWTWTAIDAETSWCRVGWSVHAMERPPRHSLPTWQVVSPIAFRSPQTVKARI